MNYEIDDFPSHERSGMGVTMNWVVWQMLRLGQAPAFVNLRKSSNPYREKSHGRNVWNYYFDQTEPLDTLVDAPVEFPLDLALSGHRAWDIAHQRAIQPLASQWIKLLPDIQAEVEAFKRDHFRGKVLAVHLRGCDKIGEYQPMKKIEIFAEVELLVERLAPDTIFLQTDDEDYFELMKPFKPVALDIPRSKLCLHLHPPIGPYQSGRWAVVDGFLGAAADWYAYTPSNFATISLIMGRHKEIARINRHCVIERFDRRVDQVLGLA